MSAPYPRPATRPVVHYVPADSAMFAAYELAVSQRDREAAKRAEWGYRHAQWETRQAAREARDRANRRIAWRVAIVAGLVLLAVVAFAVWELARTVAGHADAVIGGTALVIAACVLAPVLVGAGCKTVITIRHRR